MENNGQEKDLETTAESVENVETSAVEEKKEEKTFTRDEVNKMINAERLKERQSVINEYETKKAEAEKLAKMDEDQKKDYQLQEALKRAIEDEKKLSARDLETETLKQADERGVPLEFFKTIDFKQETAESIANKLAIFEKTSKTIRERAISEYSKETPPQTGERIDNLKPESQMTYEELAKLSKYQD